MPIILNDWTQLLAAAPWSARRLMRAVSVGDYIYMTGGNTDAAGTRIAEVWRTKDGISWELLTDNPGWAARAAHGFVYYLNKFWVFGGSTNGGFLNDVWSSDDCITWVQESAGVAWSTRHEFAYCLHKGQIYLSGGYRSTGWRNDTYRTSDMINWNARGVLGNTVREHVMLSFSGNLYCYYGDNSSVSRRWVYRSIDDAANWVYLGEPGYGPRREHCGIIDDPGQNLAIIGGYLTGAPGSSYNDVWYTTDGFNFTQIVQVNAYTARSDFCSIHHNKRLYIFGGTPDTGASFLNDVWEGPAEPYAEFSADVTSGIYPLTVNFTNESSGTPTSYLWDFGDGLTSTEENPTHQYNAPGTYTVKLTSTYTFGSYSETKSGFITVSLDFTGSPLSGSVPLKVRFNL
ncbi:MAG: PKD domain-containing protein [Desulfobacterales bacterium]